jgi:hypothetical protein
VSLTYYAFGSRGALEIIVSILGNEGQKTKIERPNGEKVSAKGSTFVLISQTTRRYILVLTLRIYHVASQAVAYDNRTGV